MSTEQPATNTAASSHAPSLAGSVIEAPDGLGGTALIRIQNMSSTGMSIVVRVNSIVAL